MSKKIVLTIFFVLIILFSVTMVHANDANSNVTADCDVLSINDNNQLNDLEYYNNLSAHEKDSLNENIKNKTELTPQSTNIYYQGDFKVILKDTNSNATLAGKQVNFVINNIEFNATTDDNGVASVNLNLNPGKYSITSFFKGDTIFESADNLTTDINVLSTIKASDIVKYYKAGTTYTATFYDSHGNFLINTLVNINVNGKSYNKRTNSKGAVSLDVNLNPGTYKIISTDPITGYKRTTTFKILPTIEANNLKTVVGDSKKFTAKFFKSNGKVLAKKWIKFKLKGKIYKVKTNSKGLAGISLKKLKKGTYNIVCYNKDKFTKTFQIKIYKKKSSTKLTTKSYTFLLNESKNIKVKFSSGWGKDTYSDKIIKISIGGKAYSLKTDSDGFVYLNLNSLNKGLYKVEYKFDGNKYFKSYKKTDFITILDNTSSKLTVKSTHRFGHGAGTLFKVAYSAGGVPLIKRTVTFNVSGEIFTGTTDDEGIAEFRVNQGIGNYTVNFYTSDESKVNGTNGSCSIEVFKRTDTKLTWKSGFSFKDSSQTFKILLTDYDGNPISQKEVKLTIDGETYTKKTSSNGYATFKTKAALGKYKVFFKFDGDNDYEFDVNSKSVNVKLTLFKNGINQKNGISHLKAFLKSSSHCPVGNAKIKKLVKSLTKGLTSKTDKAKAIFNYVRDTLAYSYYYDTKYGATGTLKLKKGNCVDHSHLLVSMFRTAGLKARYVHGLCKFSDGGSTGHVWTQVLIGKNWVCADATSYRNSLGKIANWNTKHYKIHHKYSSLPF